VTDQVVWRGPDVLRHLLVPIDTLQLDPTNANLHPPENIAGIRGSLGLYGQQKPIVISQSGVIAAGNGLWEVLHQPIPRIDPVTRKPIGEDRWTHVAVVPSDLTPAELVGYGLADNQTQKLSKWDPDQLAQNLGGVVEDGVDPAWLGFDDKALKDLLGDSWGQAVDEADDDVPDVTETAVTQLGDVWLLGPHRVVCGDAVEMVDVAIAGRRPGCVLTDPPYGIDLDTDWSSLTGNDKAILQGVPGGKYRKVAGDAEAYDAAPMRAKLSGVREQFWFGGDFYRRTLSTDDLDGCYLVWDKRNESSDGGIGSGFELIWSAQRHKRDLLRVYWFGAFGDAEARNRVHPTQKPTKLLATILDRWAPEQCLVVDPYAGSGSTVIACHRTDRVCAAVELDPLYVDVICRRWQQVTGDEPVLEATGEPYDFAGQDVRSG
jgi:DNA methylase